jgi:hypothetical protein
MRDQRGDENDEAEHVEDPDESQKRDHDLPPVVVSGEPPQAQEQRRCEAEVGAGDDQPHPPERLPERLPVRMLGNERQRDQDRGGNQRERSRVVSRFAHSRTHAIRVR